MPTVLERVALIKNYLPSEAVLTEDAGGYGWSDEYIQDLLNTYAFTPAKAVRYFWLQRVNETAEYLDLGKPLTQIHRQARAMLDYWDLIIQGNMRAGTPDGMDLIEEGTGQLSRVPISFGEIERPWE